MPKLTPKELERRRANILAAADACFLRKGFRKTSMADIAKEAGISTGAAYVHFESKDAILRAASDRGQVELDQMTSIESLDAFGDWLLQAMLQREDGRLRLELELGVASLDDDTGMRALLSEIIDANRAATRAMLEQLQRDHGYRFRHDLDNAAYLIVTFACGLLWMRLQKPTPPDDDARRALRFLLDSIQDGPPQDKPAQDKPARRAAPAKKARRSGR